MHEFSPEADEAITSDTRQFTHRLWVDWNNNGEFDHPLSDMSQYVTRSSREQAISSTAPEELMLIEGYGSASMDIEVAGKFRDLPLTGHFAPYNGRSVFYSEGLSLGVAMYYDIGVWTDNSWEWYRQFTGVVKEVEAIREQGLVRLYCLDNVEKLRTGVSVHAYGVPLDYLRDGRKRGCLVDSSSIIDLAARTGGFTMGPKPGLAHQDERRQNILNVPFHGSILPEIGMLDEAQAFHRTEAWENGDAAHKARSEAYTRGPHGYLALNGVPHTETAYGYKKYWIDEGTPVGYYIDGTYTIGIWIRWEGSNTLGQDCRVVTLNIQRNEYRLIVRQDGYVGAQLLRDNGNDTFSTVNANNSWLKIPDGATPENPVWHYVEVAFQYENWDGYRDIRARVRLNNTRSAVESIHPGPLHFNNNALSGLVTVNNWLAISDLEIARSTWFNDIQNTSKDSIEPDGSAILDWGRNRIMYTLRETEKPAWEVAKEVAAAEYGVVYFDEFGRFRFHNFETIQARGLQAPDRVFTISDVEGLSMRTTMDSVRNKWVVTTTTGYSTSDIFYELKAHGEPWSTLDNSGFPSLDTELWKLPFNPRGGDEYSFYYIKAAPNLMCPHPWHIPTLPANEPWDQNRPIHGKIPYQNTTYVGAGESSFATEQKWIRRDLVRMSIHNHLPGSIGFWNVTANTGRFRMKATLVFEDEPTTWTLSTTDVANLPGNDSSSAYGQSIPRYGERVIELGNNFWLQDEFQTRRMLETVIKKFGRPIPVTDAITVPGDPRVQIGDVIEIRDDEGMGSNIRLQVYGITREFEDGIGLVDTYQVEVVENPGVGRWDDPNYGRWDTSLIWS